MAREVNRLLAQLAYTGPQSERVHEPRAEPRKRAPVRRPRARATESPSRVRNQRVGLWVRVFLSVMLGVGMTQWPYRHECSWGLLGYFGAVSTVLVSGAWIGFASWKLRSGPAHLVALVLFLWGLVLTAGQILPRIGYAAVGATWGCR